MKNLVLMCSFLLPIVLLAQQPAKNFSMYIHGGYRSTAYIINEGQQKMVSETETSHHKCIIFNAGLQWNLLKKWRIGPSFTYDHFGTKHRSVEYSNLSYLLRCDRIWKKAKNYSLYSGLAAGTRKVRKFEEEKETERKIVLGYQIYLAGISYKVLNRFSLDATAGWGVTGILSIGATYRF